MKWKKVHSSSQYSRSIWKTQSDKYYLLVQKRRGKKSHPAARYYWVVGLGNYEAIHNYNGYEYEMSLRKAMRAAKGAVLEARICDSMEVR